MDERFTTSHEADVSYAEMSKVVYKGSVMAYVDKLINLNEKANVSVHPWCTALVNGLPHELRKDLARMQGGKPKEDDTLLAAIKEVGSLMRSSFERRNSKSGQCSPTLASRRANASGRLRSQTQLRKTKVLRLGRSLRRIMSPLLPALGTLQIECYGLCRLV